MYIKKLLYSSAMKDSEGFSFYVDYFITEDSFAVSEASCPYGILLEKSPCRGEHDVYSAAACFQNQANAQLLLEKLAEYSVTPVLAGDSIDILLESCDFKY